MGEAAREAGATVSSLDIEQKFKTPLHLLKLRKLVADADILHTHMFHANIIGRICRPALNIDVLVNTIHNVFESQKSSQNPDAKMLQHYAYEYTASLCEFTSCVSRAAYDRFVDIGAVVPDQASVVYNGINTEKFRPSPSSRKKIRDSHDVSNDFIWLSVGRFFEQKDHATLLRAFAMMEHDNARLWLVGHGKLREELEALVQDLSLGNQVELLGTVGDVDTYMATADGFALSPRWEGFGIVFAEAQATELPVVSTNVGGIPEVVEDQESGLLVPPETPDALSSALDRVTGMSQASRQEMGRKGRTMVNEKFSSPTIADEWEQRYRKLINS
jgi:glycosyltransferase involved in cell wall biosynthesis